MKKILGIIMLLNFVTLVACAQKKTDKEVVTDSQKAKTVTEASSTVIHLTTAEFKKMVFDFSTEKEWKYKGNLPCIIDFYADWCRPCRTIAPYMETLAKDYKGKLIVYKVNVDVEKEVAAAFGVSSIPLVLFCPMSGAPASQPGALSLEDYRKIIQTHIFKEL